MFDKYIGELIKYDGHYWLIENVVKGVAELWWNGNCKHIPLDDLNIEDIAGQPK